MILISFGTRPEYIKIKPLLKEFDGKIPYALLFTGQHTSLLKDVVATTDVRQLEIKDGPNRLDSIVASIMNSDHVFNNVTSVMVQGDTTSAFAVALAAFHRKLKIIHLEAGLRTGDLMHPYPEEFNRQAIARMANIHLCPTDLSACNLRRENITSNVYVVGNTVLDNLKDIKTRYGNTILITMHRRENHALMDKWFNELEKIASLYSQYEFIIPLHPNPNVQQYKHILKTVKVIEPVGHEEFIRMIANCRFIITDSGGIQEEASFLGKKCVVCRQITERVEGMGVFSFMCPHPAELLDLVNWLEADKKFKVAPDEVCPYGDGASSQRIASILSEK
tara:strand:- start:51413 stop:52417 length:1005 start_codon:yes stop_codon:yes gene_type:complete